MPFQASVHSVLMQKLLNAVCIVNGRNNAWNTKFVLDTLHVTYMPSNGRKCSSSYQKTLHMSHIKDSYR